MRNQAFKTQKGNKPVKVTRFFYKSGEKIKIASWKSRTRPLTTLFDWAYFAIEVKHHFLYDMITIFTLNSSLLTKLEFFSPRLNRLDLLKGLILWNCNMKSLNSFGSHFAMFCSEKKCLFRHRILLLISLFLYNSNIHLDSLGSFARALLLCQVKSRILKNMFYLNWRSGTSNSHF